MASRLNLQKELESILGSKNVYFQPPESMKLNYPAIVYSLSNIKKESANNGPYIQKKAYTVTLIDRNPDNNIITKILTLPMCRFDRSFFTSDLNHYVYLLYY